MSIVLSAWKHWPLLPTTTEAVSLEFFKVLPWSELFKDFDLLCFFFCISRYSWILKFCLLQSLRNYFTIYCLYILPFDSELISNFDGYIPDMVQLFCISEKLITYLLCPQDGVGGSLFRGEQTPRSLNPRKVWWTAKSDIGLCTFVL